jgi:predicted  nucleic acid-binding Zn-ribbon protein
VSKEDVRQLAALEAAIAVEDKAIAKLQRDMAGLNAEAEAVAAALEGVGGAELQEQRALAETLQQVIVEPKAHLWVLLE